MDYKRTVGNVEMVSLIDGQGSGRPTEVFPASSEDVWRNEYAELLDEEGLIHTRYGSLALRSDGKVVIVDTGDGPPDGTLIDDMARKGVEREAVDLVVLTHLHGDHVGWNLTDGRPTFPNARYLVPRDDWQYWTRPEVLRDADRVRDQVVPLEGLAVMDLIESEHRITSELTALPTPGHTPGHISIAVSSAGQHAFILGDVAHSPAQAQHTDWSPVFDVDGDLAAATRHAVFDQLESEGLLISSGHFPEQGFGRLARSGGRRYWQVA